MVQAMLGLIKIDYPFSKKSVFIFSVTAANPNIAIKIATEFDTVRCTIDQTNSTLLIFKILRIGLIHKLSNALMLISNKVVGIISSNLVFF